MDPGFWDFLKIDQGFVIGDCVLLLVIGYAVVCIFETGCIWSSLLVVWRIQGFEMFWRLIRYSGCAVSCIFETGCIWFSLLRCGGLSASCYLVAQLSSSTEEVAHKYASKNDTQSLLKFWPKCFNLWKYCRSSTPPVLLINSGCSPWKVILDEHYQAVDNKREDEDYQWTIRENNSPIFHAPLEPPSVAGWVDLISWRKRKSK